MEEINSTPEQTIPKRKALGKVEPVLSPLEQQIIGRSENMNVPALAAFFSVTEDVVKAALAKK